MTNESTRAPGAALALGIVVGMAWLGAGPAAAQVVVYNTNGFEAYGECVMGTQGTMIVEKESTVMLYPEKNPAVKGGPADAKAMTATVSATASGKPALDSSSTS